MITEWTTEWIKEDSSLTSYIEYLFIAKEVLMGPFMLMMPVNEMENMKSMTVELHEVDCDIINGVDHVKLLVTIYPSEKPLVIMKGGESEATQIINKYIKRVVATLSGVELDNYLESLSQTPFHYDYELKTVQCNRYKEKLLRGMKYEVKYQ